jgi:hypothetical protein
LKFEINVLCSLSGTRIQLSLPTNSTDAQLLNQNTGTQQSSASIVQIPKLSFVIFIIHFAFFMIFIFSLGSETHQMKITLFQAIDFR